MNLLSFSIKTKGLRNFARRLWTVFTRFGLSETRTRIALHTIIDVLRYYNSTPTFFIPAVVLNRHSALITEIAHQGTEIGIHGYFHNDYRSLSESEQHKQTEQAISVFQKTRIPCQGFRNPYLGWTEASLRVFATLGLTYESNEAIIHDVIELDHLSPSQRDGLAKSLVLFQAISCNAYTLRPHFEKTLLRIPTSIPDDEILFDRLRITDPEEIGNIWSKVMQRVYDLGGIYTLNLHPERAVLCKQALDILLSFASTRPLPVWITSLKDVAQWWKERSQFKLNITPLAPGMWRVEAQCTPRATILARHLTIEDQPAIPWSGADMRVHSNWFTVSAIRYPCISLSPQTPQQIAEFIYEQGYPVVYCPQEEAYKYATYLDMPEGLGATRQERVQRGGMLVQQIEQLQAPLLRFGYWPNSSRAALAITGDIDSVTIQDFFMRVLEVGLHT